MPRYIKNMALTAKIETPSGTDAVPTAGSDGVMVVSDITIDDFIPTYYDRQLMQAYFGASQKMIGQVNSSISFTVELAGSGTAGTAAPWDRLFQACSMASASLTTPTRIELTPVSTGQKTITLYGNDDGVLHKFVGAIGNVEELTAKKGEVAKAKFTFVAAYTAPTATALVVPTTTAWKTPIALQLGSVVDVTLGCTYAAGALSGGTSFGSQGFTVQFGNETKFWSSLSRQSAEITNRSMTCSFQLELTAAQEVTAASDLMANGTTGFGFKIGTAAGSALIFYAPALARNSKKKVDVEGVRCIEFGGDLIPVSGNDEFRIVQL